VTGQPPLSPQDTAGFARYTHEAMACEFALWLPRSASKRGAQAAQAVFDEVDRLERELSRFIEHSDVSQINELRRGESLRVGIDAFDCLQIAERIRLDTGGVFDVCFASPARKATPNDALYALDPQAHAVIALCDGLRVDLGGVGKGYAVDTAAELLVEWGCEAALIHAGQSTLYALGSPPGGSAGAWRIALRDALDPAAQLAVAEIRDAALSGSGRHLHGEHIRNPADGGPPPPENRASWAIAASAAVSDALSTAFLLLSADETRAVCRRYPGVCGAQLSASGDAARLAVMPDDAPIVAAGGTRRA